MKYYKDKNNMVFGFDETQQVPEGLVLISLDEANELSKLFCEKFKALP